MSRGRTALPANVHLLKGNPSKKPLADLLGEFRPEVEIPTAPKHLWPEAKKEWKRITPELERYGLISKLDRAALALYCQAYARWVWAEEQLDRARDLAERKRLDAEAKGEPWTGGDGVTVPTPNGHMTYSPHWVVANKAMEQVKNHLRSFGMDPSARGAVRPADPGQRRLFDDEDTKGGFGDL